MPHSQQREQVLLSRNFIFKQIQQVEQLKLQHSNLKYQNLEMGICDRIDRTKCVELFMGIIGINITFVICGVLFEWMTKLKYAHVQTGQEQYFRSAVGLICIERGIVWLLAQVYNRCTIPRSEAVKMPYKNLAICGFIIFFSSITNTEAIYMVSFPLTIMVKSCNIMSVILVGVFCSRVTSQKNKLPPKKILVAIVVTVGIVMFRFFDPEADFSSKQGQKTEMLGLLLLFASLLSDGFLPDYQAQVKQKFKPAPTEMMLEVNKWSFWFCFVYLIVIGQFWYTLEYCWYYPLFTIHLVSMSVLTFIGQIFVYRMIKQFKQHIVPFVVTTRKIITVGFSLIYFNHQSSWQQVIGIVLVFAVTAYEFISEMVKDKRDDMLPVARQEPAELRNVQHLDEDDRLREEDDAQNVTDRRRVV